MSEKTVFVDQETLERVVKELGYKPSNLTLNPFVPKNQAVIVADAKPPYLSLKSR